ncbi:MAG: ABC transporter permease, partial [Bifidobacterium sp.]|nr:ABC transporter permease [Bifidobacterium sp.]
AVGALAGTAVLAWLAGTPAARRLDGLADTLPAVMVVGVSAAILMAMLLQAMVFGEGSTLSMRRFAPYGIPDRTLQLGLTIASLTGGCALTATVCLMLWAMAYRPLGAAAVAAQLIMAPCAVILAVCFCKAVLALLDLLIDSRGGKSAFYVVTMLLLVTVCQLPGLFADTGASLELPADGPLVATLSWLPLGCLFQVPFDVAAGQWWPAVARVAIAALAAALCCLVCAWCLGLQRRRAGASGATTRAVHGLGLFARLPASPTGAIAARVLTILRRDVRQGLFLLMPLLFVVLFLFQVRQMGAWFPFMGLVVAGWIMLMGEANGLSYDGMGYAMQAIAGVDGRTDRRGRALAYVPLLVVYFVALGAVTGLCSGAWRTPRDAAIAATLTALGLGWALASLGVAEVFNCTLMYPVPSMDKPFSNPPGRMVAQALVPCLFLLASLVAMAPTFAGAVAIALAAGARHFGWIAPMALANGVGICALGVWWGAKLLDSRGTRVLDTLRSNASLQQ